MGDPASENFKHMMKHLPPKVWCRRYNGGWFCRGRAFEYRDLPFEAKDVEKIRITTHWLGGIKFCLKNPADSSNEGEAWYVRPFQPDGFKRKWYKSVKSPAPSPKSVKR